MKKVYILDGTDANAFAVGDGCEEHFSRLGWDTHRLVLRSAQVSNCLSCDGCAERSIGECVLKDDGKSIARDSVLCDLFVLITRIVFGGYSSLLKGGFERTLPSVLPYFTMYKGELHHRIRYNHRPPMLFIGYLDTPDSRQEHLFHQLALRSGTNFMVPSSSCVCHGTHVKQQLAQQISSMIGEVGV